MKYYVRDIVNSPKALHCKILRSPYPHCTLDGGFFDELALFAKQLGIVTYADIVKFGGENRIGREAVDQPLLFDPREKELLYRGQPVAVIYADSARIADSALQNISAALKRCAKPVATEQTAHLSNKTQNYCRQNLPILLERVMSKGDFDPAYENAAFKWESHHHTGLQEHAYLESNAVYVEPASGKYQVTVPTQAPYYIRDDIHAVCNIPTEKIIIKVPPVGGGFGGKEDFPSVIATLATLVAKKSGKTAWLELTMQEDLSFSPKRHPSTIRYRSGIDEQGKLTALAADIYLDAGAYITRSTEVLFRAMTSGSGAYNCDNILVHGKLLRSFTPPNAACRGFGDPQVQFALETHLHEAFTAAMGSTASTRFELRRKNILRPGKSTAAGQVMGNDFRLPEIIEILQKTCIDRLPNTETKCISGNKRFSVTRRGRGITFYLHGSGLPNINSIEIRHEKEKKLREEKEMCIRCKMQGDKCLIMTGFIDLGQGMNKAFSCLVADELCRILEISWEQAFNMVEIIPFDSSKTPNSGPTVASRATARFSQAIRDAIQKACSDLDGEGESAIHYFQKGWNTDSYSGEAYESYASGACWAEVEIDMNTYEVRPKKIKHICDIGRVVNPAGARGQVIGATVQGLGFALTEKARVIEDSSAPGWGLLSCGSLFDYHIPVSSMIPEIEIEFLSHKDKSSANPIKGLGELGIIGVAPAILQAVNNALGINLRDLPIDPETIFQALHNRNGHGN